MAAAGDQHVGNHAAAVLAPHDLLGIVILNAWPLLLRTDIPTKRSLSLVCSNACEIVGDLERDVPAQLHITLRTCQLDGFRHIQHLKVYGAYNFQGSGPGQPRQLRRALTGLADRLADVARLDLRRVPCLSGDCAAAAAACMPRLEHLLIQRSVDEEEDDDDGGLLHARIPPPLLPGAHFFSGLTALVHLTTLCCTAPTAPAAMHGLAALTHLTCLELHRSQGLPTDVAPLSRLVRLQALTLPVCGSRQPRPCNIAWVSALVALQSLHHCPPPGEASLHALQACSQLTHLGILDLWDCRLDEVAPPGHGAAPPLALPALAELAFQDTVGVCDLRGLMCTVGLPGLLRLQGIVGLDYKHEVEECAEGLAEVVALAPMISMFQLLLTDFGEEEDAAWTGAMVRELEALQGDLAAGGRAVEWETSFDSPHWQG